MMKLAPSESNAPASAGSGSGSDCGELDEADQANATFGSRERITRRRTADRKYLE